MRQKQFLLAFLAMLLCFAAPSFAQNVAKIGNTEYATLSGAMSEANKVAGDYTITLLQNSAEVFTFAQKSGVNITIDGDQNTFSGNIILNEGGGKLTFTDAKLKPTKKYSKQLTVFYLNASTAPNIEFDGCTLQGANKSGAIVYGYASNTSNSITVKNCTADNLQYIVSHRQTGSNEVEIDNVTATNMIYLARTLKCPSVTIKNTTCDAVIGVDIKNDGAGGKLTLENVNINVITYGGTTYYPVRGTGAGESWTVEVKGWNTFAKNGVECEGNSWFSGNAGYNINYVPQGHVAYRADVTDKADREGIAILLKEVVARQSLVVKVYHDETLMFTCTRRDKDDEGKVMFPVKNTNTTANIVLWGKESGSWINEIHVKPTSENVPNKVEILADGTLVETYTHESGTILGTNLDKYLALECLSPNVVKIGEQGYETLAAALAAAQAGQTITFVADVTEDVTISKAVTIEGAGKTYTGAMTLNADATIKNVNFDGKGYNGYAITTRGAQYLTIEDCTAKNYGYGFVQLASATALTTVKNVTVSDMNYGVKVDYSNAVVLENVDITAGVAAVLNSNYGGKTITIKDSKLNILGTWTRNNTIKTNYVFEGENSIDEFKIRAAIDNFKFVTGATLTAPKVEEIEVTAAEAKKYEVVYKDGKYTLIPFPVMIGEQGYKNLADAVDAAKAGETITLLSDITASEIITINKAITLDGNDKTLESTAGRAINVETEGEVAISNLTINAAERAINIINKPANVTINNVTATANNNAVMMATSATGAKLTINESDLTGLATVNVASANSKVEINDTNITNVDASDVENYGAISVFKTATNSTVVVNGGKIVVAGDSMAATIGAEGATVTFNGTEGADKVQTIVAYIGDAGFTTLKEAIAYAKAGDTVTVFADVTMSEILTVNKAITLDGNDKTLKSTAGRAINVSGANGVTIKNLTINASGERAINIIQNATNVTIDNVTATAANYTVNVASSAPNAVVAISESTLNGLCTVNVSAKAANVTVDNSTINCNDNNTTAGEAYAALSLNKEAVGGKIIATNTTVNVTEGSDSVKGRNGAKDGEVTINGSTNGVVTMVACITYEGSDYYHAFATLQAAIDFAKAGETVKLIADATGAGVVINKSITIDFNGKTYIANEGVGSAGTQTLGLQILKDNNVTLKNGTLTSAGENIKMLVQNYANLIVDNMKLIDATDAIQYVLSNNCGNVVVKNDSEITANGAIAFDACKYANYELPTVTIAEGVVVTGDVEVSATLNFAGTLIGNIIINGAEGVVNSTVEGLNVTTTIEGRNVVYANGAYTTAEFEPVAKVNGKNYASLREAVDAAPAGATVELLADVTLEGGNEKDAEAGLVIDKAMTLDGRGHTIDCGTFVKGIRIYGPEGLSDMKINNVTIVNSNANGRCVDTRKGYLRLKFSNAHLIATNGNSQPLTVGGSEQLHQIDLSGCTIDAGNSGYGIISFVPTNQAIKVMNSTVTGYAGIYLKGDGTKVTITTNSEVIGTNVHSGATNAFGAVVFEGNNNVVNINATSPMLKAIAEGDQAQAAILVKSGSGNNVVLDTNKGAEILAEGENAYWAMVSAEATGTTITKDGVAVALQAECDGIQFLTLEDALRFSKDGSTVKLLANVERTTENKNYVTDCDGYASIFNIEGRELTFDLNGHAINVTANAADLANAKNKMLLAVFSTDEGGKLTLKDSSEDKTGKVEVVANDAMVYSLITNYEDGCYVTIEGGEYKADKVYDSLIYSGASDCVTINNGNYHLGNVGEGGAAQNSKPWIFNALGQNQRNIDVNGGTFNADINHQYWCFEVDVPENLALHNNGNGTWTVVEAEAYVVEPEGDYTHKVGYPTLSEAIARALYLNNTSVVLVSDVEMTDMITVANGTAITLDLNGKTIAATDNTSKNYSAIDNRGELTITGEGVMTVEATVNSGWDRYSAVIANNPGGKLTVNGGTIEHLGGTDMAYAIDNLTNGKGTYAETIINGGTIKSPYRAIRQFLNGVEAENILTVNGGTIEGDNKSIWMQDPSKNANTGSLTVGKEASLKGDVYLTVTAGSTEWPVEVKIAKAALEGNVLSANVPDGYAVSEYPTYWTVEALNLAELTIEDACTSYVNVAEKNVGKLTYVRDFENTEWQTIYLPFAVPAENLIGESGESGEFEVAYIYNASYKGSKATIDYVVVKDGDYTLQANYPYLIRAKVAGEKSIVVTDAKLMPTAVNSIDCSSVFETFEFTGSYTTVEGEPCADATAEAHASKGHFVMNDGAWKRFDSLNPFRVYLTITLRNGSDFLYPTEESIIMRKVDKNGNVDTSVEKIGVDADILGIYDLQGRRVLEPQKGEIYIINGKKVVF